MKIIKRSVSIAGLLLCSAALVWAGGSREEGRSTLETVREQGYFVLGLDDSFPPMGFRGEDNEIVGFDIDMAREVASRMGVELKLRPVDWDGVILSLNKGDIDMVWNGMTITPNRKEKIAFSEPYLANRQSIVVRQESEIDDKEDLAGKTVGFQMGSSSETAVNAEPETAESFARVKKYSNNVEALLDLQAGRLDAVVVDEIMGRYYIAKREGVYRVLEDDFGREEYGIGFRKEDTAFRQEIDRIMSEMRADGTAAEISRRWFGEDIVLN